MLFYFPNAIAGSWRYENASGQLMTPRSAAEYGRPSRAVYEYAENDSLDKVSWYDAEGELVTVLNYSNLQTVDLQAEQSDSYVGSASLRARKTIL